MVSWRRMWHNFPTKNNRINWKQQSGWTKTLRARLGLRLSVVSAHTGKLEPISPSATATKKRRPSKENKDHNSGNERQTQRNDRQLTHAPQPHPPPELIHRQQHPQQLRERNTPTRTTDAPVLRDKNVDKGGTASPKGKNGSGEHDSEKPRQTKKRGIVNKVQRPHPFNQPQLPQPQPPQQPQHQPRPPQTQIRNPQPTAQPLLHRQNTTTRPQLTHTHHHQQ